MDRIKALEIDLETQFMDLYGKGAKGLYFGTLKKLSKWDKLTFCFWIFLQRLSLGDDWTGRDNALYYFKLFFLVLFSYKRR